MILAHAPQLFSAPSCHGASASHPGHPKEGKPVAPPPVTHQIHDTTGQNTPSVTVKLANFSNY